MEHDIHHFRMVLLKQEAERKLKWIVVRSLKNMRKGTYLNFFSNCLDVFYYDEGVCAFFYCCGGYLASFLSEV